MTWGRRRHVLWCSSTLLLAWTMLVLLSGCKESQTGAAPSPPIVEVVEVIQKDVPVHVEWIASTDGMVNATIRAQVQGYLIRQNYKEGDFIQKGQVLFEIDPRPFQAMLEQTTATLNQAKAALVQSQATLEQAKAEVVRQEALWANAKATFTRIKQLTDEGMVSQKDLDDATGAEQSARAAVAAAQAAVGAAQATIGANQAAVGATQAAMSRTQLDLGFTKILSPIDGIAGIAKAQMGNLVGPGTQEELTTVSTVDPIKVYIPLSEQEYLKLAQQGKGGTQYGPFELILANGSVHPHPGRFAFADRQVDVQTGTIKVAVLFANPGNILRPGQFARVRAQSTIKRGALLVPQRAVTELQGGYQVAVVGPDNRVDVRPVKAAERIDTLWVIDEGLKSGERVVAEGVQKVQSGTVVNPKTYMTPPQARPETPPRPGKHPNP
jgi:membrane fusion protein (multidrug efflux system)